MARREHQMPNVLRQNGPRPYWYVRYRRKVLVDKNTIERRETWHRLGYCDEMTKREAERTRDEVLRDINREVYTIKSHVLFKDFAEIYRRDHFPTIGAGTRAKYTSHLDNHLLPVFGNVRLCDIDTQLIQTFLNAKAAADLAWWTRNDLRNLLKGMYTMAASWKFWQDDNPVDGTKLGRKRAKRPRRILSAEELQLLLGQLPTEIRLMVQTAVSTGLRVSEILGLKWKCVDLNRETIAVQERFYRGDTDEPKSDTSRREVPLGCLARHYRDLKPVTVLPDAYVFHAGGEPLDDRALLKDVIRPAAKRLGIYFLGFGWHSFRRQNITVIQEVGATVFEAQAQAGHSDPAVTSEYTIIDLERRKQAVVKLQERLLGSTLVN